MLVLSTVILLLMGFLVIYDVLTDKPTPIHFLFGLFILAFGLALAYLSINF